MSILAPNGDRIEIGDRVIFNDENGDYDITGTCTWADDFGYPFTVKRDDGVDGGGYNDGWSMEDVSEFSLLKRDPLLRMAQVPIEELGTDRNGKPILVGDRVRYQNDAFRDVFEGTACKADEFIGVIRDDGIRGGGINGSFTVSDGRYITVIDDAPQNTITVNSDQPRLEVLARKERMTKKDYELVAAAIKVEAERIPPGMSGKELKEQRTTMLRLANDFSDRAMKDNPRFDRTRFYRACGLA